MNSEIAGTATAPGDVVRYRCAACGNLTRFDVTTTRRTRAYHHYSVGGDLTVEDVTCRWCGNGKAVEVLEAGAAEAS